MMKIPDHINSQFKAIAFNRCTKMLLAVDWAALFERDALGLILSRIFLVPSLGLALNNNNNVPIMYVLNNINKMEY
jgi:hypothetical protein